MFLIFFILILIVLILVHEFGHFSVAKLFKIRVDEFGIFFPPRIGAVKYGETEYSFNWLPFGGFVRIFGENANEAANDPRSFAHKPRLAQAAVVVAGIVFNLLFAWLVLSAGYVSGLPSLAEHKGFGVVRDVHVTITAVLPNSPAGKAGVMTDDVVKSVQTANATLPAGASASEVQTFIISHADESIVVTVVRDKKEITLLTKAAEGVVPGRKAIGIDLADLGVLQLPPHLALLQGALLAKDITVGTAQGLGTFFLQIVRGGADFSSVAGPIGIASLGSAAVEQGFASAAILTALISINLALINLIPIPGLDGGRLLFIIVESIIRRPVPPRFSVALTLAGFALLILLMVVVSAHDIARLVG